VTRRSNASLAVVCGVAIALGSPARAIAQVRASIDVGGASVHYGDSLRVTATTVAPTVRIDGGAFSGLAFGGVSMLGGDSWSSQGGLTASLLSSGARAMRVELAAAGTGTMMKDGGGTGQLLGRLRLHASGTTRGSWLGGAAGRAWDGSTWRPSVEGDLAGWVLHDDLTMVATVRPAASGDSIRFTDVSAMARQESRRLELSASAGFRSGVTATPGSPNAWASVSAALWFAPQLAVVADGGSYPADIDQGFPGGRYLSLSLRIAPHRRLWVPRAIPASDVAATRLAGSVTSSARVEVVPTEGGSYAVRVHASDARRVEIMGDFTDWKPTDLTEAAKGWWQMVTRDTPGERQMTIRIDGGRWTVPAGATAEQDEFGQPVGVIIVR
jgi:hypothetical protein